MDYQIDRERHMNIDKLIDRQIDRQIGVDTKIFYAFFFVSNSTCDQLKYTYKGNNTYIFKH